MEKNGKNIVKVITDDNDISRDQELEKLKILNSQLSNEETKYDKKISDLQEQINNFTESLENQQNLFLNK